MERSTRPPGPAPLGDIQSASGALNVLVALALASFIVAALYFGQAVLIPLALASLLSFALAPPVRWLRRRGANRFLSVTLVVITAFSFIAGFWTLVGFQLVHLAQDLPRYQTNLEAKIEGFKEYRVGGGVFDSTTEMFRQLRQRLGAAEEPGKNGQAVPPILDAKPKQAEPGEPAPMPVEIRQPPEQPLETLYDVAGPLLEPLATGGIVIVFVVLMMIYREDLRNRVIRLAGASDLHRTTEALDDAAQRVGRYLLMQLVINSLYAFPIGIGLWLIGVPNPLLWALFALILRFVPYVGAIVSSAFPLILAIAVDPGWSMFLWTAALFATLEILISNVVEPLLYGASTGLSPLAVILAAIFWTWLWGPIGLLLSTPLTVCLAVLGRHVPQLDFFHVLLGSEPVLTDEERLYERLLAGDPAEGTALAEEFVEEDSLADFYQKVAIPALSLAERDRVRGVLDDEHRALIGQGMLSIIEDFSEHEDVPPEPVETEDGEIHEPPQPPEPITPRPEWQGLPVLCMAGRGELDEASAAMLGQLIERRGLGVRNAPHAASRSSNLFKLDTEGVRIVCVCYMNADSIAHARFLVRRLRRKAPDARILVAMWNFRSAELGGERDPVAMIGADIFAMSLTQAADRVIDAARTDDGSTVETPSLKEVDAGSLKQDVA